MRTDAFGQLSAEYSTGANAATCTTCYLTWDHLGSVRMITNQSGNVVSLHDYLPFGEEVPAGAVGRSGQFGPLNDNVAQKFTGKERDQETDLDFFGARYYGSVLGRFISPDWSVVPTAVPYAVFTNPQSLNLYAYMHNNPMGGADADGHCGDLCSQLISQISLWAGGAIARDGGVKPFAENVATGIAKGGGSFVVNTVKGMAAAQAAGSGNLLGAAAIATASGPSALQPSNTTQAQVSTATQVGLTVASIVAPPQRMAL